jgi:bifunctional enzyme CysN/CysC
VVDAGLVVLDSFISPFRSERRMARNLMEEGESLEVVQRHPLALAEQREVKGLHPKARRGENFTGLDGPYGTSGDGRHHLDTNTLSAEEAADLIVERLG